MRTLARIVVVACGFCCSALAVPPVAATMPADASLPTLWIIGDSTVRKGDKTGKMLGWGDAITPLFDTAKINVVNRGQGGESTRTYRYSHRWEKVLRDAKPGDYVIIQFGHNDWASIDTPGEMRGTLHGVGDETRRVYNDVIKQDEDVHTFGWYIGRYLDEAKAAGLTAIVCSPVPRLPRSNDALPTTEATSYQQWVEEVAKTKAVAYVNLFQVIWKRYKTIPSAELKIRYFTPFDNTHTNPEGATVNAECVVEGLRGLRNNPLAKYLKELPPVRMP